MINYTNNTNELIIKLCKNSRKYIITAHRQNKVKITTEDCFDWSFKINKNYLLTTQTIIDELNIILNNLNIKFTFNNNCYYIINVNSDIFNSKLLSKLELIILKDLNKLKN